MQVTGISQSSTLYCSFAACFTLKQCRTGPNPNPDLTAEFIERISYLRFVPRRINIYIDIYVHICKYP